MKVPINNHVFAAVLPGAALASQRRIPASSAADMTASGSPTQDASSNASPQNAPEIITTGIHLRPNRIFASSGGSGSASNSGELPPSGAGGAGSGNGPKADPIRLGDDLEAFLEAGTQEDLLLRRVRDDLKALGSDEERLSYLAQAGSLLSTPAAQRSFPPEAIIRIARALARSAERLTPFVTADGVLLWSGTDIHNLMHSFYIAAHDQEEKLLQLQHLDAETAERVADIRFAFARRGLLYYAFMTGGDGPHCRPSRIALMLLDLEQRYQALCLGKRSLEARALLRELREPLGIHWQEEAWAMADLQQQVRENLEVVARQLAEPTRLMLMLRAHDVGMENCIRGIYSYSPRLFAESAFQLRKLAISIPPTELARNVLLRKALEHEQRANREMLMASRLGLSALPEEI